MYQSQNKTNQKQCHDRIFKMKQMNLCKNAEHICNDSYYSL